MPRPIFWPFLLVLVLLKPAQAAIDLVTLPTREGTPLTIYNSEDMTMVREHRLLTVKQGVNRIQFSWANTLIDPTSIEFRILDQQDKVDLVDTTFPAGRNEALQWNITSQIAGKIPVEIRYFTSGITWAADYVGIANEDETKLNVTGYVRVTNGSAGLRQCGDALVVGNIDLVKKIADLAQEAAAELSYRDADTERSVRKIRARRYDGVSEFDGKFVSRWRRGRAAPAVAVGPKRRRMWSSRASPNTFFSPSRAARTSRTRNPSAWWP